MAWGVKKPVPKTAGGGLNKNKRIETTYGWFQSKKEKNMLPDEGLFLRVFEKRNISW